MNVPLSDANRSFVGQTKGDGFGAHIAGFGDVNNDGFSDFAISAVLNDEGGTDAGKIYFLLWTFKSDSFLTTTTTSASNITSTTSTTTAQTPLIITPLGLTFNLVTIVLIRKRKNDLFL